MNEWRTRNAVDESEAMRNEPLKFAWHGWKKKNSTDNRITDSNQHPVKEENRAEDGRDVVHVAPSHHASTGLLPRRMVGGQYSLYPVRGGEGGKVSLRKAETQDLRSLDQG